MATGLLLQKRMWHIKKVKQTKSPLTGMNEMFQKLKFKCTQGTLKLKKVHVIMDDGTKKEYDAKGIGVLSKGMSSFAFDMPGK